MQKRAQFPRFDAQFSPPETSKTFWSTGRAFLLQAAQKASKFYCEPMPLEATGDVLIYTALAAAAMNSTSEAELYLPALRTFAAYIAQNGRDPLLQLCTDDYLGPSALNANLAAKSVRFFPLTPIPGQLFCGHTMERLLRRPGGLLCDLVAVPTDRRTGRLR